IFILIFMLHLWPRRLLIIRLFKETNKTLKMNPFIIFQPIITSICLMIFLIFWSIVGLYLSTANVFMSKTISTIGVLNFPVRNVPILHFEASEIVYCFRILHFLLLIWILEFIFAAQRMIIAGAVACAYFSRNEPLIKWPILNSTVLLFRYHLGSIAFGSLVIFVFKIPRALFLKCYQRLYRESGRFSKCSQRILGGILGFFVTKLRPLHHNAFTPISVAGVEFCTAAQN
uniref:Choline transporter-like protein n=1 Tax=Panagrolaimus sp. JU765 TaxID=591449 RepID=A0AC34Q7Q5_9BILA